MTIQINIQTKQISIFLRYMTRNMTQKNKTPVNTDVLPCGRWDLNPKMHYFNNSHKISVFLKSIIDTDV